MVLMIEIVERLRELKGIPRYVRRLSAGDCALDSVVRFGRGQQHLPEILTLQLPGKSITGEIALEVWRGLALLRELPKDVARAHGSILDIGTGLAFKAQCFLKVECDHRRARELEQEVTQRADRDIGGNGSLLGLGSIRMARGNFIQGLVDQLIDEIIGFDADA